MYKSHSFLQLYFHAIFRKLAVPAAELPSDLLLRRACSRSAINQQPLVKHFGAINETYEKAARSYESTCAVFRLTEILEQAVKTGEQPAKRNTRNQKQFEKLLIMQYGEVKLTVGLQRSNRDLVQYCITVPNRSDFGRLPGQEPE